ncbi:MAG: gamma-glutamyltransferase [Acidimicrobiia bacterium]|nr:gamma-glutamyltransferase [Acidimicrobiia bacterium]
MSRIVVAGASQLSADVGAIVSDAGGNAVDTAIAANLIAMITEPGVCALGGGGFVTVWPCDGPPVTFDGYMEMPGRDLPTERFGHGSFDVTMNYGGGMTTTGGYGSIATPGALAAFSAASRRFGALPWGDLLAPVIEVIRSGFPISPASRFYLGFAADPLFNWHPDSRAALFAGEHLIPDGDLVRIPALVESLSEIAEQGVHAFYEGDIGAAISHEILESGGILTRKDLAQYRVIERPSLQAALDDWHIATNPAPAIGGVSLAAMLLLLESSGFPGWDLEGIHHLVRTQQAVLGYRREYLDVAADRPTALGRLLEVASTGDWRRLLTSPSTVHASAVDDGGNACAVTMSAGYGSGAMPGGTGIWMNNSLGELELNMDGFHALPPGTRLVSNMAPTVGRRDDGAVLSIGSPGADRITTAILSTLLNLIHLGMPLGEAVQHPRLHVEYTDEGGRVAYEPGIPVDQLGLITRPFETTDMFFGGVGAALYEPGQDLIGAADHRRTGGVAFGGA